MARLLLIVIASMQTEQIMRTAITIWNNRVSPVFDVTASAMIFDSEGMDVRSSENLQLSEDNAIVKIARLVESQVDVLVCGAISRDARTAAVGAGIKVYAFIAGDVTEVLQALLNGRLNGVDYAMPGCGCRNQCHGKPGKAANRRRHSSPSFFCEMGRNNKEV